MPECCCALVFAQKKLTALRELTDCEHDYVRFVPFQPEASLSAVDAALHKGAYDAVMREYDPQALIRWNYLNKLSDQGALIEPLMSVVKFSDRSVICRALEELAPAVQQPRFALLPSVEAGKACAIAAAAGLCFPLICKPVTACGPFGHNLAIVLREEGLRELCEGRHKASLSLPLLAQEFVSHASYSDGSNQPTRTKACVSSHT